MFTIARNVLMLVAAGALISCEGPRDLPATEMEEDTPQEAAEPARELKGSESLPVTLTPLVDSPKFPDASLDMKVPEDNVPPGEITFYYEVNDFELTGQTPGAAATGIANSGGGQHIHQILNNEPYTAHYNNAFTKTLPAGHHVALSFLSRSYHESLKHPQAYVLTQFIVGDVRTNPVDLAAPHLFYSRPKGAYNGEDTGRVLLDFFLVNADLSADGYQVEVTINEEAFTLTDWTAYIIEGLPLGENTIRLELVDEHGETVPSPFNPMKRTITLSK